jgi:hypothetical protein
MSRMPHGQEKVPLGIPTRIVAPTPLKWWPTVNPICTYQLTIPSPWNDLTNTKPTCLGPYICFAAYLSKSNAAIYWSSSSPPPPQTWNLRTYRMSGWILSDLHRSTSVRAKRYIECRWPHARSHLHSVGPRPSHASFTAWSSSCSLSAPAWELFLVGNQCDNSCVSVIGYFS